MPFPNISPIFFSIGFIEVRWYSLMYIIGFLFCYFYFRYMVKIKQINLTYPDIDLLLTFSMLGVLIGTRLFYVLFYNPKQYWAHPEEIFQLWKGGLSFHGGLIGVAIGAYIFSRMKKVSFLHITDFISASVPFGLGVGRIGNFINGELYGRQTTVPWGMIFPNDPDGLVRHPSQLYQSGLEGFTLFLILLFLTRYKLKDGALGGLFLIGYGVFRFIVEYFRQPDDHLGFIFLSFSMGQLLCFLMIVAGSLLLYFLPKNYSRPRFQQN